MFEKQLNATWKIKDKLLSTVMKEETQKDGINERFRKLMKN